MLPKYSGIQCIVLHGFYYQLPQTIKEVEKILESHLPTGFIKDYNYGLGLKKEYLSIIQTIEESSNVNSLLIHKCNCKTEFEQDAYHLNIKDYDAIINGIDKINSKFQSKRKNDKSVFVYNALLNTINPNQYPRKHSPYKKDSVLEFISSNDIQQVELSVTDQKEIVNLVSKNTKSMVKQDPKILMKLHNEIELVTLENVIENFEKMLHQNLLEKRWQKFFDDNSFILSMAFGYPSVKVRREARVGLGDESGSADKKTDFLFKNKSTNNSALIEIKTPDTPLLNKSLYRDSKATEEGNVYSMTSHFSGAINQILDQKYKLQQDINTLQKNSEKRRYESYSVDCLLIIGRIPEDKEQKRFFELFRGNSKDIEIITFDELLEKLKLLHSFLSSKAKDVQNVIAKPNLSSNEKANIRAESNLSSGIKYDFEDSDEDVPF